LYTYDVNPLDPGTFQAVNGSTLLANLAATYAWDTQGRMTNMTYPSGPQLAYQYDAMGRLSQITSPNYPSTTPGYTASVSAAYTAANQLSTLQYGAADQGIFTQSRSYNSLMQLTGLTTNYAGTGVGEMGSSCA
jgi:YD repeat-containing protein